MIFIFFIQSSQMSGKVLVNKCRNCM